MELYPALTMLAHHHVMKTRDNVRGVIDGLQRKHGLLAAYLEATDKVDWRALHQRTVIAETPEVPSPFVFRRANLVPVPTRGPRAARAFPHVAA